MTSRLKALLAAAVVLALGLALSIGVYDKLEEKRRPGERAERQRLPAPVEVAPLERGSIALERTFTGTLEARAEFIVAPKIGGRVRDLRVDLADAVSRGDVVALLDDDEYVQDVARARADLAVEQASHAEAVAQLRIAERELERLERIQARGDVSASAVDTARSEQIATQSLTEVARARIARAEADLEAARIRLGYTQVRADWEGGGRERFVAERYIDAGETVAANAPLLRIVELDPITAVFFVTERDYALLAEGQQASLSTDAYPGRRFEGRLQRIAPVFHEATRQARVELRVDNPGLQLRPGMFARATVRLRRVDDATIVPEQALTLRDDSEGIFLVAADGASARWQPVTTGIRQDGRVQVIGDDLRGEVVVLGQQLLEDGSPLRIVGGDS